MTTSALDGSPLPQHNLSSQVAQIFKQNQSRRASKTAKSVERSLRREYDRSASKPASNGGPWNDTSDSEGSSANNWMYQDGITEAKHHDMNMLLEESKRKHSRAKSGGNRKRKNNNFTMKHRRKHHIASPVPIDTTTTGSAPLALKNLERRLDKAYASVNGDTSLKQGIYWRGYSLHQKESTPSSVKTPTTSSTMRRSKGLVTPQSSHSSTTAMNHQHYPSPNPLNQSKSRKQTRSSKFRGKDLRIDHFSNHVTSFPSTAEIVSERDLSFPPMERSNSPTNSNHVHHSHSADALDSPSQNTFPNHKMRASSVSGILQPRSPVAATFSPTEEYYRRMRKIDSYIHLPSNYSVASPVSVSTPQLESTISDTLQPLNHPTDYGSHQRREESESSPAPPIDSPLRRSFTIGSIGSSLKGYSGLHDYSGDDQSSRSSLNNDLSKSMNDLPYLPTNSLRGTAKTKLKTRPGGKLTQLKKLKSQQYDMKVAARRRRKYMMSEDQSADTEISSDTSTTMHQSNLSSPARSRYSLSPQGKRSSVKSPNRSPSPQPAVSTLHKHALQSKRDIRGMEDMEHWIRQKQLLRLHRQNKLRTKDALQRLNKIEHNISMQEVETPRAITVTSSEPPVEKKNIALDQPIEEYDYWRKHSLINGRDGAPLTLQSSKKLPVIFNPNEISVRETQQHIKEHRERNALRSFVLKKKQELYQHALEANSGEPILKRNKMLMQRFEESYKNQLEAAQEQRLESQQLAAAADSNVESSHREFKPIDRTKTKWNYQQDHNRFALYKMQDEDSQTEYHVMHVQDAQLRDHLLFNNDITSTTMKFDDSLYGEVVPRKATSKETSDRLIRERATALPEHLNSEHLEEELKFSMWRNNEPNSRQQQQQHHHHHQQMYHPQYYYTPFQQSNSSNMPHELPEG